MTIITCLSESFPVCLNIMITAMEQVKRLMTATVRSLLSLAKLGNQKKNLSSTTQKLLPRTFFSFCAFTKAKLNGFVWSIFCGFRVRFDLLMKDQKIGQINFN